MAYIHPIRFILFCAICGLIVSGCKKSEFIDTPGTDDPTFQYELVEMETNYGNVVIWLYYQTPLHRDNFLKLTNEGFYDGLTFHRVVDDFVIQGGDPQGNGTGGPGYQIDPEFFDELRHVQGAVAAARTDNPQKRSSGSQFYIVEPIGGAHFLDGEYTVFGQVIKGIPVVEEIADQSTDGNSKPLDDVLINQMRVVSYTAKELSDQFGFTVPF
ncbi:MAG: peptidylprolyl isomerase [Bacteroidota bacterium]